MRRSSLLFALVVLLLSGGQARADDTDLFLANPGVTSALPNVLLIFDNSANWSSEIGGVKKYEMEHNALYRLLTQPEFRGKLRIGMMGFAHGNSPKGGKVLSAVQELTAEHQEALKYMLYTNGVIELGAEALDKANNAPYALALNEAYLYIGGKAPASGTQDGDHDPAAIGDGGNYFSPMFDNHCGKNYIIVVGNGSPDNGENNDAEAVLTALGGRLPGDPIRLDEDQYQSNWADEFSRFIASTDVVPESIEEGDQNVVTYVVDVYNPNDNKANTKSFKGARAFLKSIAQQGKGRYFTASSADEILAAFTSIFDEVQAVNSVFASTTLPVSVNVRGTNLNQVYMGVFRPDPQHLPRWFGNLKLYQLAVESGTGNVYLADKNGLSAQSPITGFIVSNAVSFWTTASTFWDSSPRGMPETGSDSPDGEVVEKGAAAQKLREDYPTRNLYTCTGGCTAGSLLSLTPFADGNAGITQAALGAADAAERSAIIEWIIGENNSVDGIDFATATDVRPSVHGDVLHSRPAVINYNRDGTDNDIVAYYGANDGVFHAVKGGKGDADGYELWGFIPQEHFGQLKRLRDNTVIDLFNPKPYFVDGTIGVYQQDANGDGKLKHADGDKVYLYMSMRRGGRILYALDVSDPDNPKFLWKVDQNTAGFAELGQSWSEPKVAKINLNGTATPVLIFGAGYDPTADDKRASMYFSEADRLAAYTMGRGLLVLNAASGEIIWQAGHNPPSGTWVRLAVSGMDYSLPSDVTILNRDGDLDGYADRMYVGDTGGNLWRIDIGDPNPDNWVVRKLAQLGGAGSDARKFLYPPDVVYAGGYDALLLGSGNREDPFDDSVTNRFYMLKDSSNFAAWPITEGDLYDATANLNQVGTSTEQAAAQTALQAASGWYITLNSGEKVVGSAVTLGGSTFFNTNQPVLDPNSCNSTLGIARGYVVSYKNATATDEQDGTSGLSTADRVSIIPGGGYPPSPVPVIVEIGGKKYQAVISGTDVKVPPSIQLETRQRVFWYKEID